MKFEDAKAAPATEILPQIKKGDQLNARGTRSADGDEMNAEEIVSGTFPYIEGIIKAVDAPANTITVQDAVRKSAVVVKMSPDSLLWKLPPEMDQRFAARLKGATGGSGDHPNGSGSGAGGVGGAPGAVGDRPGAEQQAKGRSAANGPPDLQRLLSRLPKIKLADLQKGDAVIIRSTEGAANTVTAIKVVAGVEAILTAAPIAARRLCSHRGRSAQPGAGTVKVRSRESISVQSICLERTGVC